MEKIVFDVTRMDIAERENLFTLIGSICGFFGADYDCLETVTADVEPSRAATMLAQLAGMMTDNQAEEAHGIAETQATRGTDWRAECVEKIVVPVPVPVDMRKCEICGNPLPEKSKKNRRICEKKECANAMQKVYQKAWKEKNSNSQVATVDVDIETPDGKGGAESIGDSPFGSETETWIVETGPARGARTNLAHMSRDSEFYSQIQGEVISHPGKGKWMVVPQPLGSCGETVHVRPTAVPVVDMQRSAG